MIEHLIKKYPNRRLYDTQTSKYIKLDDLRDLLVAGAYVKVVDSSTEEDITRTILLQIIMDAENSGKPLFSSSLLQQIIRLYSSPLHGLFAKYIEESLLMFCRQQDQLQDKLGTDTMTSMADMAQQNMQAWARLQANFFNPQAFGAGKSDKDNDDK